MYSEEYNLDPLEVQCPRCGFTNTLFATYMAGTNNYTAVCADCKKRFQYQVTVVTEYILSDKSIKPLDD